MNLLLLIGFIALKAIACEKQSWYKDDTAYVMPANPLCSEERTYVGLRSEHITSVARGIGGSTLKRIPRVAVCLSGGGIRAMVGSLGFLKALEEEQILSMVTYISALSGSTWALAGWLQSSLSIADYLIMLKSRLYAGLFEQCNPSYLINELLKKLSYQQPVSLIDLWGVLIAAKVLLYQGTDDLTDITLENYRLMPNNGSLPLPLYSCVTPLFGDDGQLYRWVEWSPYQIRCTYLNSAIPLWGLGRVFTAGKSITAPPTMSLSFGLGIWGSAMSGTLQEMINYITAELTATERVIIDMLISQLSANSWWDDMSMRRISPAEVLNWDFNRDDSLVRDQGTLTFIDAGFLCNIPLLPVLDPLRAVDVIIIMDFALGADSRAELPCVQEYAHAHDIPFPHINKSLLKNICSVHGSNQHDLPTIIYFPLVPNPYYAHGWDPEAATFTSTFNLVYSPDEIDLLAGLTYSTCRQHAGLIKDIILNSTLTH